MTLGEKLKILRKERKLSLNKLREIMINLYIKGTYPSLRTLQNIENSISSPKYRTIAQIANIFGLSLVEFLKDVELDVNHNLITKEDRYESYTYGCGAKAESIYQHHAPFLSQEIVLKPKMKTSVEQRPSIEDIEVKKYIYVIKGRLTIVVNNEIFYLKKGSTFSFNSSLMHFYKNTYDRDVQFLVTTYPKK